MNQTGLVWPAVIAGLIQLLPGPTLAQDQDDTGNSVEFADVLVSFDPAPGQFANNPLFDDPTKALGPPVGGGTGVQDTSKVVSLGGFAGSVTLGFSQTVMDDPCNPYGIDAIVFGNAIYAGGQLNRRFAEAAIIEIARDTNANGVADDPWYVIPGSHLSQPPADDLRTQVWDANTGNPANPPSNPAWIPPGYTGTWQTAGYQLPTLFHAQVIQNPYGLSATLEGIFGYGDSTPVSLLGDSDGDNIVDAPTMTPEALYTVADNPFTVGVDSSTAGGDGFDIAWAVDPIDGLPARLDGFDFVRLSTGVNFISDIFGEVSAEIAGVSNTRPNVTYFEVDANEGVDVEDLYAWHGATPTDFTGEQTIDARDSDMLERCVRRGEIGDVTGQ